MIRCIIIEDEHLAAEKIYGFVSRIDFLSIDGSFDNGTDAINHLVNNETDLIFLDINLPGLNGMQLIQALQHPPKIIITSAESTYALTGYEYNVSDYLLKPFGFDRFLKAVTKVAGELTDKNQTPRRYIFIKAEYKIERIDLAEVKYIEGMKDYLSIALSNQKVMTLMSFAQILKLLPASDFMRVHKSFIVSLDKIRSIEKSHLLIGDRSIPLSDTYRDQFLNFLKRQKNMI